MWEVILWYKLVSYLKRIGTNLALAVVAAISVPGCGPTASTFSVAADGHYVMIKGGIVDYLGEGQARIFNIWAGWDDQTIGSRVALEEGACLHYDDEISLE